MNNPARARAIELIAQAHDLNNRPLVAVDFRNNNLGKAGVQWVQTETAIKAVELALLEQLA